MNPKFFMYLEDSKQYLNFDLGLYTNDLYYFSFETFFLLSIILIAIFFVVISNKPLPGNLYFNSSVYLVNILFFIVLVLFLILNNNLLSTDYYLFGGFYYNDYCAVFFKNLTLLFFFCFIFAIKNYLYSVRNYDFEFVLVLFLSLFSSILIVNANDLISLFFIIELQSLTFYILVSSKQTSSFSTESGLKYFILGCFSSGIILFGISLIYGFSGLLSYNDISLFLSTFSVLDYSHTKSLYFSFLGLLVGLVFLTIGLLFKLGAVPFHMWMPDVYEGSPILFTAYLSTIPKVTLIFVFFKLYYSTFFELFSFYQIIFILTALLSISLGSIAAIYQIKIKRLLTYSMITNTGYLVLGLSLADVSGIWITLFYLISYIIIMIGLFFCFILLRDRTNNLLGKKISILVNVVEVNPVLSFSIFILIFSIAGIPPLFGFYGKFFLFFFILKVKLYWTAILFVIFSAISVFYYIRLVKIIYFNRSRGWIYLDEIPFGNAFIISLITAINLMFFLNPNLLLKLIYNFSFYFYL